MSVRSSVREVQLFGTASKTRWNRLKLEPHNYDHLVNYRNEDWQEQIHCL